MAVRAGPPIGRPSCETKLLNGLIDRRDAARAQIAHDMRDHRTTKPVKKVNKNLSIAKDDGQTNVAMLWLRDGKMRKWLLQMKMLWPAGGVAVRCAVPQHQTPAEKHALNNMESVYSFTASALPLSCSCSPPAGMQVSSTWARRSYPPGLSSASAS